MSDGPVTAICHFRVRSGEEEAFRALLRRHWPTLREQGLATATPTQAWEGTDREGRPYFVEIFEWQSEEASRSAHETPEVLAIWKPMGGLVEERDGRPPMEFLHPQRLDLG
jgi:quinol monooxygenase YgiN